MKTLISFSVLSAFMLMISLSSYSQSNDDCFMCHDDKELTKKRNGKTISLYVNAKSLQHSVHSKIECISCHKDLSGAEFPHEENLKKVNCGSCHDEHAQQVTNDIHHVLKDRVGENGPSCKSCHGNHKIKSPELVKDKSGYYCGKCHEENVLSAAYHTEGTIGKNCIECHDEHDYYAEVGNSVHDGLTCANCHGYVVNHLDYHQEKPEDIPTADCYLCHRSIAEVHRESVHGISIAEGINEAAHCWDCHGSHTILLTKDDSSKVKPCNLAETCGKCHDDPEFTQKFHSTVKQPGKMYNTSIHGQLLQNDSIKALSEDKMIVPCCKKCHGIHNIKNRIQEGSLISATNLPNTCEDCHEKETKEYKESIHWIAVKKGVRESPTCNDCHSEHGMQAINTDEKRDKMKKIQEQTCLQCHQNLILSARYGIEGGAATSYQDSYHGLAVMRGDEDAAMCIDCHGVHKILPDYHKESSIHPDNVVQTCQTCHEGASEVFSKSYSHIEKEDPQSVLIQNIIRIIYTWLIIIVIGGMIIHNLIIFIYDMRKRYKQVNKEIRVPRFNTNELIQHVVLLVTFILLAITGFQLKYPESWWSEGLTKIGLTEPVRQFVHRASGAAMIALSVYHVIYLFITARGRAILVSFLPTLRDFRCAFESILYHMHLRKKHPEHDYYDYTEKVEYWALIWGTIVMGVTGFILWFPTILGDWAPVWLFKVSELFHFYEAILATLAIVFWHWFFVIFRPQEYPMSFTCVDGKMTVTHYRDEHMYKFKQIMVEYLEEKAGRRSAKKVSNLSRNFIQAVEKAGVSFEQFIKDEMEKNPDIKTLLEEKDLLGVL
jgi:predicted CXXCH cytochrome family protein